MSFTFRSRGDVSSNQINLNRAAGGPEIGPFNLNGRSAGGITVQFSGLGATDPDAVVQVQCRATESAPWAALGALASIKGIAGGNPAEYLHFADITAHSIRVLYVSGGAAGTRLQSCAVSLGN